jgi:outer membrane protein assembly factor BamB
MIVSTARTFTPIVGLLFSAAAFSQTIALSPTGGPPTTSTEVSGSGFAPRASIDISFDTTELIAATADGSGSFSDVAIQVPASALPGQHTVSAVPSEGGAGGQATFTVNTNWNQYGFGPNHAAYNPYENVLSPSTVGSLELQWTSSIQATPTALVDGVVYAYAEHAIYALNARTGAPLWGYAHGPTVRDSPIVASGVVYFVDGNGAIYALNARTGAELWTYASGANVEGGTSLTIANGVLYFPNNDYLVALNASTGALLWNFVGGEGTHAPAVANGVAYVESLYGALEALDANTGALLWSVSPNYTCCVGGFNSLSPAVADGVIYVSDIDNDVLALDAGSGAQLWSYTNGHPYWGGIDYSIAAANGLVYFGSYDHNVYALKASTGSAVWGFATGGLVDSLPTVANGVVYVASADGNLYALNARTGAELWSYAAGVSSPVVANGKLYAVCGDNVCAFGLPSSAGTDNQ